MPRDIGVANSAAVGAPTGSYQVDFVELIIRPDSDDFQLRFSTLFQPVSFSTNFPMTGDKEFTGAGHLMNITALADTLEVKQNSVDITLSALDTSVVALLTENPLFGSRINIYRGYYDENTGTLAGSPYIVWSGTVNDYATAFSNTPGAENTADITVSCRRRIASILESINGRYTSPASFGSDRSMEFVANMVSFNPTFGKED